MSLVNCKIVGEGIPVSAYLDREHKRGDPARRVTRSDIVDILRCPHKWRFGEESDEPTAAMIWGTVIDSLVLPLPAGTVLPCVVAPACYPSENQKTGEVTMKPWHYGADYCKDWRDDQPAGVSIIGHDNYEAAQLAAGRLRDDATVRSLLSGAKVQVFVAGEWSDDATGLVVPVGMLLDIVPPEGPYGKHLADLKSTGKSATDETWSGQVYSQGYHVQGAMHMDGYNAATGENRQTFLHVIQESEPPYETARKVLDQVWLDKGRGVYQAGLRRYCECLKSQEWPGYNGSEDWTLCSPKPWMILADGIPTDSGGDGLPEMVAPTGSTGR